jgi:acetyl-CoA carboxylase biotin carboxylase subunit
MIRKVLVANRGEIAIRIFRTLREMGVATVAVFTDPDAKALHVKTADENRRVESYLDADEIVAGAIAAAADAIHPGYGFLSENPKLPAACEKAGVIFIGPKTETVRRMGDKLESKLVMRNADVPVVPSWDGNPPASEYPVLVKAVGGGGGKGMRLVETPADLAEAMASASREAGKAFGNDRVFIEKFVRNPRHIEFQIFGDTRGNAIHLFERECSIQRRHQKIIEETPSTALTPELRSRMGDAAVAAARAVDYVGAGTVEFIVDPEGRFYFLEMNTRLQVEHPVTELTTGLDLVREQNRVAEGQPLSVYQSNLRHSGHSIECRIYAEVPEENFRPSTGTIAVYRPPAGPGIRVDSGVEQGSEVSFHYDPMLAKLIVWAASRDAAIERMKRALGDFVLLGVQNNIEFLHRVISTDDFRAGRIDTGFLERHPDLLAAPSGDIPAAALLAAPLGATTSTALTPGANAGGHRFSDIWTSGAWRNS